MIWIPLIASLSALMGCVLVVYLLQCAQQAYAGRQVRQRLYRAMEEDRPEKILSAPEPTTRPDLLPGFSEFLRKRPFGQWMQDYLRSADWKLRAAEFLYGSALLGLAAGFLAFFLTGYRWAAFPAGLAGSMLPFFFVRRARSKRLSQINNQLRDWLMLMSSCLRSGHSWAGAMEMAARDMEPPMAEELTRLLLETQRGVSWEEAFKNLLRRAPSVDLELIIVAILTQREVGGNLGEILAKILYTVQERVRLQGEIRVLASQGVLSGLVVGLLPISVGALLTLIEPTYLQPLLAARVGQIMLGGSLLLQALGGLFIKKLVSIEY